MSNEESISGILRGVVIAKNPAGEATSNNLLVEAVERAVVALDQKPTLQNIVAYNLALRAAFAQVFCTYDPKDPNSVHNLDRLSIFSREGNSVILAFFVARCTHTDIERVGAIHKICFDRWTYLRIALESGIEVARAAMDHDTNVDARLKGSAAM